MWAPCFSSLKSECFGKVAEHANFYSIKQSDVLPLLSRQMKNYFNFMYSCEAKTGWLTYVQGEVDEETFEKYNKGDRWMWSTPGFLMSAGMGLDSEGNEVSEFSPDAIFTYLPVVVDCNTDGVLNWHFAEEGEETNVKMFTLRDVCKYQEVMAQAVKKLLVELP